MARTHLQEFQASRSSFVDLSTIAKGLPVREFVPYKVPQSMRDALKRVEEFKAIPSFNADKVTV